MVLSTSFWLGDARLYRTAFFNVTASMKNLEWGISIFPFLSHIKTEKIEEM
jgi:hypothetical protein